MRRALLAALFLVSCARRAPDGAVLRALPRCEANGPSVEARPLEDSVQPCMRLLAIEPVDSSRSMLGLSTDDAGRITRVCLVVSTQEADSRFLNCVADQLERATPALPPNQVERVWTLNASY